MNVTDEKLSVAIKAIAVCGTEALSRKGCEIDRVVKSFVSGNALFLSLPTGSFCYVSLPFSVSFLYT